MIFSNPTEYAIRALSELTLLSEELVGVANGRRGQYIMLDKMVENAKLPREFIAKICRQLVEGGILISAKGPGGGFALARKPHEITLADVMAVTEGPDQTDRCVVGFAKCDDEVPCPQHDLFKPIRQRLKSYLASTTLADTAASLRDKRAKYPAAMVTAPTEPGKQ